MSEVIREENDDNGSSVADMYRVKTTEEPKAPAEDKAEVQETPAAEPAAAEAPAEEETIEVQEPPVPETAVEETPSEDETVPEAPAAEEQKETAAAASVDETPADDEPAESSENKKERKPSEFVGGMIPALKGMISFFTIFRLPIGEREMRDMETKFWLVPIVGLLLGLIVFAECFIFGLLNFGTGTQALIVLATVYVLSKFLHFDGLVDFGDGMVCSSADREAHIRALKDTRIGAGGLGVALITVLLSIYLLSEVGWRVEMGFILTLGENPNVWWLSIAFVALALEVLIKNAMVAAAAFGTPSNGMAGHQVECTDMNSLIRSTILTAIIVGIITALYYIFAKGSAGGLPVITAVIVILYVLGVVMSVLSGWLMARLANRTFGFVNGDVLGATNEIARVVILFVAVIVLGAAA